MPRAPVTTPTDDTRDVVVVGGGHNGLAAAAYLASAGKRVTVLERLGTVGGAAVSAQAFDGVDARLSRYSYLVSLLPGRIIRDLGLDIRLARRRYSSYTPDPARPGTGLLIDNADATATAAALGADDHAWNSFYSSTTRAAEVLFPTVTEPLLTRTEARAALGDDALWDWLVERPIGEAIEERFSGDVARGVALTDALIGTFAPNIDPALDGNRCFLYHVIGGGTGDWDVPVGGMGAVSGELARAARLAGAEILTDATVTAITPDGDVTFRHGDAERTLHATWVLANTAPAVLAGLLGDEIEVRPEGAQVKVNLLVKRLPRLLDSSVDPAAAFGGTFHINETWTQLDAAYRSAARGALPGPLPCEIYCHSLTDPSILSSELQAAGAQTLTVFGLHTPHRLVTEESNDALRAQLQQAVLDSLNSVLAEPINDLLLTDATGAPTIETKTTLDLEHALAMPGGNIFHGPLTWPFVEDDAELATPAQRWGVATRHPRILLCGSGAQRGGAVSAIGGHNAAMAVLESGD
ncbi:NAD(P)/FAD-dependent oxidoreductase [Leifsonia sp. AK011]|uniref:phytoene desaturase family protein n=1 Tax=Leifsonia sp. AK011 TaxID=2723075 RepID=UPI0015CE558C|nr:NAD(P)/FAD-dependent oxidoreductase [Leifsonia sp. AK011]